MNWTEAEIKKTIRKHESVDIYRDTEDGEDVRITVYYNYTAGRKGTSPSMENPGHPPDPDDVEIILALFPDRDSGLIPTDLSPEEEQEAREQIYEEIANDEDPPDSYDRERFIDDD